MPKIDALLDLACSRGASDLHLGAERPPFARVHGELEAFGDAALSANDLEALRDELLDAPLRRRLAADHAVAFARSHRDVRVRGHVVHAHGGLRAALRIFPARVPTLGELGCPEEVTRLADVPSGLVLVGGASGSGRTTLLAAIVERITRTHGAHVVTLEAPIEILHEPEGGHVTQREIGTHAPSFAVALRDVAREAADVVVVSALPDAEAIDAALALAASGIAVFAVAPAVPPLAPSPDLVAVVTLRRAKDRVTYEVAPASSSARS